MGHGDRAANGLFLQQNPDVSHLWAIADDKRHVCRRHLLDGASKTTRPTGGGCVAT
jgi:hypothetical protein